jgi:hypothetical protein
MLLLIPRQKRYAYQITKGAFASISALRKCVHNCGESMESIVSSTRQPVLTSWKEIAAHFGKGVRTVQRWESTLGLPVRRPQGAASRNIVMATPAELDGWFQTHWKAATRESAVMPRVKVEVEQLQTRLRTFQELKDQNLRLQREMKDAVLGLLETCRALKESPDVRCARELTLVAIKPTESEVPQRSAS